MASRLKRLLAEREAERNLISDEEQLKLKEIRDSIDKLLICHRSLYSFTTRLKAFR